LFINNNNNNINRSSNIRARVFISVLEIRILKLYEFSVFECFLLAFFL